MCFLKKTIIEQITYLGKKFKCIENTRYSGKFSENKDAVAIHKKRLNTISEKMQTTPNDEITDSIMELFADDEYSAHVACALNQSCMNKDQKITLENIDAG